MRASREALGLSTAGTSTPISFSRRPGLPSLRSAYIGWKQPAVSAARAATAMSRTAIRVLANDIHDPHGNYDYLADGLAAEGEFYRIERQNGSLNFPIWGQLPSEINPDCPRTCQHSSARCGIIGANSWTRMTAASRTAQAVSAAG